MSTTNDRRYLLGMPLTQLKSVAKSHSLPPFATKQIMQWVYGKCAERIDDMTNIAKQKREELKQTLDVGAEKPLKTLVSKDGTEKYLFPTKDGQFVETVLITDKGRNTLCVSTQVGCKMNCIFCQTGKQGFQGNLSSNDILAQIQWAIREKDIDNLVFMGQGEPGDNLDNLLTAIELMTSKDGFAWSPRRITVSTVGLKKNMRELIQNTDVNIAVSLHSPFHEQRLKLVPAEKQFSIVEIVELLRQFDFAHQRRLSFEYIVFDKLNDTKAHADSLLKLLKGIDCRMNLIRFHKLPGVELQGADNETMTKFRDYLTHHGLFTTIRASKGEDIMAACGMLSTKIIEETNMERV